MIFFSMIILEPLSSLTIFLYIFVFFELDIFLSSSKNTKIYKKIVKDDNGSKIIIEKKIIEEISGKKDDDLVFEDDSDDEDIEKELNSDKKDMKYQIITEKFDPQGNKIYSEEILTNKLPKKK